MRNLRDLQIQRYRRADRAVVECYGNVGDSTCGVFQVPLPRPKGKRDHPLATVIASAGDGWEHVSVSLRARCPTWDELEYVKRLFFRPDEVAMQLHLPPSEHTSAHPFCLHLWRPTDRDIPRPPAEMVA